ncbi:MAG: hypothetical protein SGARI_006057 [Bacillariaceae sp.]
MPFEKEISEAYSGHVENKEEREILSRRNSARGSGTGPKMGSNKHIIFVLDESGSMQNNWGGVVVAYNKYLEQRLDQQLELDLVSVIQFDNTARVTVQQQGIASAPNSLPYNGSGTQFLPAAQTAYNVAMQTPTTHAPVVVFMSDGMAHDAEHAATTFAQLNSKVKAQYGSDLELHVIGFGGGTDTSQLRTITNASPYGSLHTASDITNLSNVFVQIAGGGNVANVLEEEIGKRIYDAVTDRLSAEYAG